MSDSYQAAHHELLLRCMKQLQALAPAIQELSGEGDGGLISTITDNLKESLAMAAELAVTDERLKKLPATLQPGDLLKQALSAELVLCVSEHAVDLDFDDKVQLQRLDSLIATVRRMGEQAAAAAASRQNSIACLAELRESVTELERLAGGGERSRAESRERLGELESLAKAMADSLASGCEQIRADLSDWLKAQRQLRSPLN